MIIARSTYSIYLTCHPRDVAIAVYSVGFIQSARRPSVVSRVVYALDRRHLSGLNFAAIPLLALSFFSPAGVAPLPSLPHPPPLCLSGGRAWPVGRKSLCSVL